MTGLDISVLQVIAKSGELPYQGAAVNGAISYLQGCGYITKGMVLEPTDKGWAKLAELGFTIPGKLD